MPSLRFLPPRARVLSVGPSSLVLASYPLFWATKFITPPLTISPKKPKKRRKSEQSPQFGAKWLFRPRKKAAFSDVCFSRNARIPLFSHFSHNPRAFLFLTRCPSKL